jgi:uncharacterized protein (TIGR02231 family)
MNRSLNLSFRATLARALTVAGLAFSCQLLSAAPIEAESRITGVVVYENSAIVTREATVELAAGVQVLHFSGLPESVNPNLLQVAATGTAKATILDVTAYKKHLEEPGFERLRELAEQWKALNAEMEEVADRIKLLEQQRDYLERIKTFATTRPTGDNAGPVPAQAEWENQLAFYAERQAALAAELRAAKRQQEQIVKRAEAAKAQQEDLEENEGKTVQNVIVRYEVATPGKLTIRMAYQVEDARWEPAYDVRIASDDKSIQLAYAAMVKQRTGEDWRGVQLRLSTAQLELGGKPPVFEAWVVGERATPSKEAGAADNRALLQYTKASEVSGLAGNFIGAPTTAKAGAVELLTEAATTEAAVTEGLGAATFTIPFAADVPADNGARKYGIGTTALEGVMNFLAQPKLSPHTYLRARVTNAAAFPLLEGDMNIYLDGAFVASSSLPTVMTGAKFVLNLGVDAGFTVKRKLLNRLKEDTGAFAKRARLTYDVLITVENNHKTTETVIVKDQLPVSRHEKVVVTMIAPAANQLRKEEDGGNDGAIRKDADGTLSWTLILKPGEKREIPLKFQVEYPAEFPVVGLE